MALTQNQEVVPPLQHDKDLSDYSTIIQGNLFDLFTSAHTHTPSLAAPSSSAGNVGDIYAVKVSSVWYLYIKVDASTWKKVALS